MRVLLVDNHDSYTFNVFQLLARVLGEEPRVLANDAAEWEGFDPASVDAVVVSPGPGHPAVARDLGRVPALLSRLDLPVLGVCLGHQAIAHLAGARVDSAPEPRHGHLSRIRHTGTGLFAGVPQDFTAVRYHSLAVSEPLPDTLRATAWAEDGVIMALEHRDLPRWGVQFHPESISGEYGAELISGFLDLARPHARRRPSLATVPTPPRALGPETAPLHVAEIDRAVDTEHAFVHLYSDAEYAFWLDSSRPEGPAHFSFLGAAEGPTAEVLTYDVGDEGVRVRTPSGVSTEPGTVFDALERRTGHAPRPTGLPFDLAGGYVGYLGYELKADSGASNTHTAATPDAVWMRCDRLVAVDHHEDRTYVVSSEGGDEGRVWVEATRAALVDLPEPSPPPPGAAPAHLPDLLERPGPGYVDDVKTCLGYLAEGESYEICLTDRVHLPDLGEGDDLDFYRRLRAAAPAPYASFLRLGEVTVMSASPERFLRVGSDRVAESRPIKGTAARHADPEVDARIAEELRLGAKTRAENLMIVDLLRNDLGRVCEIGSVEVPAFMYVESHATVHQLVSTIQGRLRPEVTTLEAVRACFPAGSMTGAPKERTMEIIDRLEGSARGVYSGALGYVSHTGEADLSVVIRTAVRAGSEVTVGAGGAIVLDSVPEEEYEEMLLKAGVPARGR